MSIYSNIMQSWEGVVQQFLPLLGARGLRSVTPTDNTQLPNGICRAVIATGAGNISIIAADDLMPGGAVIVPFAAGEMKAIHAKSIQATGTTATGIIAIY